MTRAGPSEAAWGASARKGVGGSSPPSDTNPNYTAACARADSAVGVVREVHAELVVDRSLVLRLRVREHRHDVFDLANECLDRPW